jgi:PadR family transcriptional regulator PadR
MNPTVRSLFLGMIKIHILHHADREPVFGLWLIDELQRHGYNISPGTLYPIFHSLEQGELLRSYVEVVNGKTRKYYRATAKGRATLEDAKIRIHELVSEVLDGSDSKDSQEAHHETVS